MLIAIAIGILLAMILLVVYAMFYVSGGQERPLPPTAFDRYRELSPYFPKTEFQLNHADKQPETHEEAGRIPAQSSGERGPLRVHPNQDEESPLKPT